MTVSFQVGDREFGGSGNLEVDFWVSSLRACGDVQLGRGEGLWGGRSLDGGRARSEGLVWTRIALGGFCGGVELM